MPAIAERQSNRILRHRIAFCLALIAATSNISTSPVFAKGFVYDQPTKNGVKDLPDPILKPIANLFRKGNPKSEVEPTAKEQRLDLPATPPGQNYSLPPEQDVIPASSASFRSPPEPEQEPQEQPPVAASIPQMPLQHLERLSTEPWWNQRVSAPIRMDQNANQSVSLENLVWMSLSNQPHIEEFLSQPQVQNNLPTSVIQPTSNGFIDSVAALSNTASSQPIANRHFAIRYAMPTRVGPEVNETYASVAKVELREEAELNSAILSIQHHVADVSQKYWTVFYYRAALLQGTETLSRLISIAGNMETRAKADGRVAQVAKAKSTVANQQAKVNQIEQSLKSAEAALRATFDSDELAGSNASEIIPTTLPFCSSKSIDVNAELSLALLQRPEVRELTGKLETAIHQHQIAPESLREPLNVLTTTYLHRTGEVNPMELEATRSSLVTQVILNQRSLEAREFLFGVNQKMVQFSTEIECVNTELQSLAAEHSVAIDTTISTVQQRQYLLGRLQQATQADDPSTSLLLEELIDVELRLNQAEGKWALAQASYMMAVAKWKLSSGEVITLTPTSANGSSPKSSFLSHSHR